MISNDTYVTFIKGKQSVPLPTCTNWLSPTISNSSGLTFGVQMLSILNKCWKISPSWLSKGTVCITVLIDKVQILTIPWPEVDWLPVANKSPFGWNLIKVTDWPSWPQSSWSCLNCPSLSFQMATPPSTCPTAIVSFLMSTSLTLQGWGKICKLKCYTYQ